VSVDFLMINLKFKVGAAKDHEKLHHFAGCAELFFALGAKNLNFPFLEREKELKIFHYRKFTNFVQFSLILTLAAMMFAERSHDYMRNKRREREEVDSINFHFLPTQVAFASGSSSKVHKAQRGNFSSTARSAKCFYFFSLFEKKFFQQPQKRNICSRLVNSVFKEPLMNLIKI
jgi:hypothetical protein